MVNELVLLRVLEVLTTSWSFSKVGLPCLIMLNFLKFSALLLAVTPPARVKHGLELNTVNRDIVKVSLKLFSALMWFFLFIYFSLPPSDPRQYLKDHLGVDQGSHHTWRVSERRHCCSWIVVVKMESRWWLVCLCLAALTDRTQQNSMSCDRVRKLLQLQQINTTTGVLDTPGAGKRPIKLLNFPTETHRWNGGWLELHLPAYDVLMGITPADQSAAPI